jgi:hypothetical protein
MPGYARAVPARAPMRYRVNFMARREVDRNYGLLKIPIERINHRPQLPMNKKTRYVGSSERKRL